MKHTIEKISILSLSLMLVSTFAVSPALPAMMTSFASQGISGAQVEFLITVTSLAIMGSLLVNPWLSKFLSEPVMISLGLVLVAVGGGLPLVSQSYALIFLGRLVLGFGLGLINARAINIPSQYYQGQERLQVLGWRGAAEVLGSASLTALVGLLLPLGWSVSFAIYLLAFVILGLYLAFVPKPKRSVTVSSSQSSEGLGLAQYRQPLFLAIVAAFVIHVNTFLVLKIPLLMDSLGLGTAQQASLVLSAMMLMGIVAGLLFSPLMTALGQRMLPLSVLIFALMVGLASWSQGLLGLAIGAIVSGFFYSIVLTLVFNKTAENTSDHLLNQKMTMVLIGCNLGGASSSVLPALLERVLPDTQAVLGLYAILGVMMAVTLLVVKRRR